MSSILIVDEQPVTRHALRLLMESEGHEVVGEADSGPLALQLARRLMPDLVILELSIPGLGGLEVIQRLLALDEACRILVLTTQDSKYFAGRCLQAGARGFVSKQQAPGELKAAVTALLNGQSYFPGHALSSVGQASEALQGLSVRELTVLQLLARGFSNVAISEQLAISDKTVSTYKVRLMQKLNAASLVELIDIARRHGLLEGSGGEPQEHADDEVETELRERLELLQKLIDAMPTPLTLRDPDGRLMICNQAWLELANTTREQAIGTSFVDLPSYIEADEAQLVQEAFLDGVAEQTPVSIDRVADSQTGRRTLSIWSKPLRDVDGNLIGMFCGSEDHTEREELVRQLRDSTLRAEAMRQVKNATGAAVTREIGAAVQGISGTLGRVLARPVVDETQRDLLKAMREIAENLQGVFSDLDDFFELDAGRMVLDPRPHDLRKLVDACLSDYRSAAIAKGLELRLQEGQVREARVWVDAARLRQVLGNLLSNALRFTDHGSVVLHLNTAGTASGHVEVVLEVEDSGIGIATEELEHLFEPFRQVPDQKSFQRGGTGIGLTLCERLVRLMGGSIELSSQPGVGTRARVQLLLPSAAD
ncbi:Virulence factors putative positive transcription regulator BvgA [compost metagenome]